jgi:putative redox protein
MSSEIGTVSQKIKVDVTLVSGMNFIGKNKNGQQVSLDAKPEFGGKNKGHSPLELVASGLAGCTAMDVISILVKKRQYVSRFEVAVEAERTDNHPKIFTNLMITYIVDGKNIKLSAVKKAVQLSYEKYCPAIAMFRQICPISYVIYLNGERESL